MTVPHTDGRDEWLRWRNQGIGSSDIAAIVGLSPWASPFSVWAEKRGRLPLDYSHDGESIVQEFGRRAEAMIGPWFHDRTGLWLRKPQHRGTYPEWPVARCTADGLAYTSKRAKRPVGVVEMKTAPWERWDEIPDHYQCQAQWQMLVLDLDEAWLPTIHGKRFEVYHLRRSHDDGAFLLREARRFWTEHVEGGQPPPVDAHAATTATLGRIDRTDATVELDELRPLIARYVEAKRDLSTVKAVVDGLANELKAALGDGEVGTVAGVPVVTFRTRSRKPYTVDATTYRVLAVAWKD